MTAFLHSIGYEQWILHVLLLLPLVGVVPILLGDERSARWTALVVTTVEFVLSVGLWWSLEPRVGVLQLITNVPWIPAWGISYRVGLDGISLVMVLLTTLLMPLSVLASWHYITSRERGFYALMLTLLTGMVGVFLALDMFLFYVFFEVMLIPMYFIIGIWGGTNRLYAAIKFFVYTMTGSLLMLVAIVVLVWKVQSATGLLSFSYEHLLEHAGAAGTAAPWLFAAFALAFAIKVPIFPFHTWLPDAHVEAPTAGSVLLAGVMLKIGTYGFLRFANPFFPEVALSPDGEHADGHAGRRRRHLWRAGGDGAAGHQEAGGLFLGEPPGLRDAGHLGRHGAERARRADGDDQPRLLDRRPVPPHRHAVRAPAHPADRCLRRHRPGGAGLQPDPDSRRPLVDRAAGPQRLRRRVPRAPGELRRVPWATGIATTGVIFAAAYLLWALQRMIFNRLDDAENQHLTDLTGRELAVMLPLVVGIVWLGLYPAPVLRLMEPATKHYLEATASRSGPEADITLRAAAGGAEDRR